MAAIIIQNPNVSRPPITQEQSWPSCETCGQLLDICPGVHWQSPDWEAWELDDTLSFDRYEPVL